MQLGRLILRLAKIPAHRKVISRAATGLNSCRFTEEALIRRQQPCRKWSEQLDLMQEVIRTAWFDAAQLLTDYFVQLWHWWKRQVMKNWAPFNLNTPVNSMCMKTLWQSLLGIDIHIIIFAWKSRLHALNFLSYLLFRLSAWIDANRQHFKIDLCIFLSGSGAKGSGICVVFLGIWRTA